MAPEDEKDVLVIERILAKEILAEEIVVQVLEILDVE